MLKGVGTTSLAGLVVAPDFMSGTLAKSKLIVDENNKPGTTDWQLSYVKSSNFRSETIEGYCSHTSISAGETLDIFVSANPA